MGIKKLFLSIGFGFVCALCSLDAMSLHEAAGNGDLERVKELLVLDKTRVNERQPETGASPLHEACWGGHFALVEFLLEQGAAINAEDFYSLRPLHLACASGHLAMVKLLLEKGAREKPGSATLLHRVCESEIYNPDPNRHLAVAKYLIEQHHVPVGFEMLSGTPLRIACKYGRLPLVSLLITKGADLNAKDRYGRVPLHYACESNQFELVKMLVENGAKLEIRDKEGKIPRDLVPQESPIAPYLDEKMLEKTRAIIKKRRAQAPLERALQAFSQSCAALAKSLELAEQPS